MTMLKLMKYEMRKTLFVKLVLLALATIAEVFFLVSLNGDSPERVSVSILLLVLLAVFGILFMGISSILTLHKDMNTKQSYMLFMTPNSRYSILGAKVLENGLSTVIAGAFFFVLGLLDIGATLKKYDSIEGVLDMLRTIVEAAGASINFRLTDVICFTVMMVASWLMTVTTAYLADVISSSVLNGKKGGLLISFVLFILLTMLLNKILSVIPFAGSTNLNLVLQAVSYLVLTAVMYYATAVMMEKYLSV